MPWDAPSAFMTFENDLDAALEQMTEAESESLVLHEIGEVKAGEALGEAGRK